MRMCMRRFTRLTNGFSKKLENLTFAVSLHYMHYNFCRPHATLTKRFVNPTTPAMAAGVARYPGPCISSSACSARQTPAHDAHPAPLLPTAIRRGRAPAMADMVG